MEILNDVNIDKYMTPIHGENYPLKISDDSGYGYRDDKYFSDKRRKWKRIVTLEITSFIGYSGGATHYYGKLIADGVDLHKVDSPNVVSMSSDSPAKKDPLLNSTYDFELRRPITKEEIDADEDRWFAYDPGDPTSGFASKKELIDMAFECFKFRFVGKNWAFYINDTTENKSD